MQKIKQFIPWLGLSIPLIGVIDQIVREDLKSLLEILMLSATVGGTIGMLIGAIAAAVQRSVKLGIWIVAGSVFGCALVVFGLLGLIVMLDVASNVLRSKFHSTEISTSNSDTPPGAAEAAGLGILLFGLIPVALLGGGIGAKLYYGRYQGRE